MFVHSFGANSTYLRCNSMSFSLLVRKLMYLKLPHCTVNYTAESAQEFLSVFIEDRSGIAGNLPNNNGITLLQKLGWLLQTNMLFWLPCTFQEPQGCAFSSNVPDVTDGQTLVSHPLQFKMSPNSPTPTTCWLYGSSICKWMLNHCPLLTGDKMYGSTLYGARMNER